MLGAGFWAVRTFQAVWAGGRHGPDHNLGLLQVSCIFGGPAVPLELQLKEGKLVAKKENAHQLPIEVSRWQAVYAQTLHPTAKLGACSRLSEFLEEVLASEPRNCCILGPRAPLPAPTTFYKGQNN